MLRGNNREKIFVDEEDKARMIDTLGDKKKAEEYFLYAFCVMDNHIHLIIKDVKERVAKANAYMVKKNGKKLEIV
jgi:REP element-mobilizing transposase RayT